MTRVLIEDIGMTVGSIATFHIKNLHPRLATLEAPTLCHVTKRDTVSIAVPEGPFLPEFGRLCDEDLQDMLMFGSPAKLTGQGQQFRVENIEPVLLAYVDLIVNYGLHKWHVYGGGCQFDVENMQVLHKGSGYEFFRDRILRWFPHLPEDLGGSLYEDPETPNLPTDRIFY